MLNKLQQKGRVRTCLNLGLFQTTACISTKVSGDCVRNTIAVLDNKRLCSECCSYSIGVTYCRMPQGYEKCLWDYRETHSSSSAFLYLINQQSLNSVGMRSKNF